MVISHLLKMPILPIVACCVGLIFVAPAQSGGEIGGMAYCQKTASSLLPGGAIEFPSVMGPPEVWANLVRQEIFETFRSVTKGPFSIDAEDIPSEVSEQMKIKGLYIFPCAITKTKSSWRKYWLSDTSAIKRIKHLKRTYNEYMNCLYGHRNEINKLNKNVIEHTCKKRTGWTPPGFESVAQEEIM
jgi:hypothetical protein